jgi:hypothetical protein
MRLFLSAVTLGLAALLPVAAHATPVIYTLNLASVGGNIAGGSGFFAVDAAPSTIPGAVSTYLQNDGSLSALGILIDHQSFTLANAGSSFAQFTSGALTNLNYFGFTSDFSVTLSSTGLVYSFSNALNGDTSFGNVSAAALISPPSPSTVPEPSTLALFGSGTLGLVGLIRRRFTA